MSADPHQQVRRARVLRPVHRALPPAISPSIRTNRPQNVMPPQQFAISALALVKKLRQIHCQIKEYDKVQLITEAVKQSEAIYVDLESLASTVCQKPSETNNNFIFYNLASEVPDMLVVFNQMADVVKSEDWCTSMAVVCGEQLAKNEPFNSMRSFTTFHGYDGRANIQQANDLFLKAINFLVSRPRELRANRQKISLLNVDLHTYVILTEFGKKSDPEFVTQIKTAILVKNGNLCRLTIGAASEQLWTFKEGLIPSAYKVFRSASNFANFRMFESMSGVKLTSIGRLNVLFLFLQSYILMFSSRCVSCRKYMKDFMPPTLLVEFHTTKPGFQHETCAHLGR